MGMIPLVQIYQRKQEIESDLFNGYFQVAS